MFAPGATGSGVSIFVTDRFAEPTPTVVVAVAVLLAPLESAVVDVAVAALVMTVPFASDGSTATTSVKTAFAPAARVATEQLTGPVPPTAGVVHDQPPGDASDTNVVPVGTESASATLAAALG